jgi:lipopolysaccharide export system protein LptA
VTFATRLLTCLFFLSAPVSSLAQGSQVAFGNTQQDSNLPVEVTAETLDVNQNDNTAVFTGNVVIGQGEMRLSAPHVLMVYKTDQSGIQRLEARGGVTIVSGQDAAEGNEADYDIDSGIIELRGNVLLVQGPQALTSDKMMVDTRAGTARMTGRVKTVLQPEGQ